MIMLLLVCVAAEASAQNLLNNGGFDTDLSEWSTGGSFEFSWDMRDAQGSNASGSVRLVAAGGAGASEPLIQCAQVNESETYTFGAESIAHVSEAEFNQLYIIVYVYGVPECFGAPLGFETQDLPLESDWNAALNQITIPSGGQGAHFRVVAYYDGTGVMDVGLDNAFLLDEKSAARIFADGFEPQSP